MQRSGEKHPSEKIQRDADADKAPDPRRHYDSPEDLREDVELDLATREALLREWKQDLDRRLESESEGMSASDPMSASREAKLAAEVRRVSKALEQVSEDLKRAAEQAQP
jgi:hypothetical protein